MAQAMPDVREEILKLGGIRPIIAAMNNYPQEPPTVGWVLRGWQGGFCEIFWHGKCDEKWQGPKDPKGQVCQMLWHVFMDHGSQELYILSNFSL